MRASKSLGLINAITAGNVAPSYSSFGQDVITFETYRGYVDMAHRLCAHFGTSQNGFKSIGQMKELIRLCAGKKKIEILGNMPGTSSMTKNSLLMHVSRVGSLLTEHEIAKGKVMLPDMSDFEHYDEITKLATEFVFKLHMLNVGNLKELERLADEELWGAVMDTNKEWGEVLYSELDAMSYINFWLLIVCMFYHVARERVNSKELREQMGAYAQKQGLMKKVAYICASDALQGAIVKGRL